MSDTPPAPAAPPSLETLLRDIGAAIKAGDMPRAFTLAREGLDRGFEHPGLFSLRALWLEEEGRFEGALIDLDRALKLAPQDYPALNAKGLLLDKLRRPHDAVAAFEAVVAIEPRFAPAYHNLGWAREAVGDLDGARMAFEHALALKPDYVEPLAHLARLSLRRGDANGARIHAEQALRIDPQHPTALIALAEAELAEGQTASAEGGLRTVLSLEQTTPFDRGLALNILGDALDAEGRFPEAFAAYADGNRVFKTLFAPRFDDGRAQTASEMLLWLINYMSATSAAVWRPRAAAAPDPDGPAVHIFMVGFPRSGSTFLENTLASDPSAVRLKDVDALSDSVRDFMTDAQDLEHLAGLDEAHLEPYRRAYWRRVRDAGVDPTGKLFIDALPLNAVRAPLIVKLFPAAKMVFTLRDPRDMVLSCFRRRFQINPVTFEFLTLDGAVRIYDLMMRLVLLQREKLPLGLGLVRYEDVVENPEAQLLSTCEFLGIDASEAMRGFAAVESVRFAAPSSAGRGFYGETVGGWRRYADELAAALDRLKPWVGQFGYSERNP